ncbi:MAG: DUF2635 domain-containing protein [Enhydrobacter sp.]|nr:DUF2635 domain-containing protein [Enhydrobacter sp.]
MWFTPAEGMTIPDPATRRVCPPGGMWVPAHDEFWQRRALDGGGTLTETAPEGGDGNGESE